MLPSLGETGGNEARCTPPDVNSCVHHEARSITRLWEIPYG